MKYLPLWLSLASVTLITACVSPHAPITLQTIGPEPSTESHTGHKGSLMVYTDWTEDSNVNRHSPYTITAADEKLNQTVANSFGRFDGGPIAVTLPVGDYQVAAGASHIGKVIVPVQIRPDQTTYVYLDGYRHLTKAKKDSGNFVMLPNGKIAGWTAK